MNVWQHGTEMGENRPEPDKSRSKRLCMSSLVNKPYNLTMVLSQNLGAPKTKMSLTQAC